jgi:hypothetical protein
LSECKATVTGRHEPVTQHAESFALELLADVRREVVVLKTAAA